ncbi:MAG: DUF1553 domain-containing protein [Planctomyces sp.]|nr:DUF1553 domain-containing protein [Planctomyces sp.]
MLIRIAFLMLPAFLSEVCLHVVSADEIPTPPSVRDHNAAVDFFESKIRPVLIQSCYECHNSNGAAEGGLAVDFRDGFLKGGASGAVIVPGDSQNSRLIPILRHEIEGLKMPDGGPRLTDAVINDFVKWIDLGAYDPRETPPTKEELEKLTSWDAVFQERKQWWSFQPISNAPVPDLSVDAALSSIDRFVYAQLQPQGLKFNPPAESDVLVRRLFLVLTGMPPAPDQILHWAARIESDRANPRDQQVAVSELVDHLLQSPQFGERWARHWMDWIRYADSHGSEGDPVIDNAWHYRDYLIRALNSDVPVNQLIREHVAGDLLNEPRVNNQLGISESAIGTAHWRMVFHGFAPTDALDERVRFTDDQMNAFSKAFLGITLSCARCHDHKFDAISQKDYYAIYGILDSCRPARTIIDLPDRLNQHRERLTQLRTEIRDSVADAWLANCETLKADLASPKGVSFSAGSDAVTNSVLQDFIAAHSENPKSDEFADWWRKRQHRAVHSTAGRQLFPVNGGDSRLAWYMNGQPCLPDTIPATYTIDLTGPAVVDRILPIGMYSHLISTKDPARLTSSDILLDAEYEVWVEAMGDAGATVRYVVQNYPRNGTVYPVSRLTPEWSWHRFDVSYWMGDTIHIELSNGKDAPLLVDNSDRSWFGVRKVLLVPKGTPAITSDSKKHLEAFHSEAGDREIRSIAELATVFAESLKSSINSWRTGQATDAQVEFLQSCMLEGLIPNDVQAIPGIAIAVDEFRRLEAEVIVPTRVPGIEETVGRDHPLYVRGNHKQPAEIVPRRFLEAISPAPYTTHESGRRQLAEDLVSQQNPLTRRVMVNRLWHHLFGHGIVRTPDNLGRMGQLPSHPELLDWLARDFETRGWSIKSMIREIVLSRTWQQSSVPTPEAMAVDPDNKLFSHYPVRRLEGEAIRDSLLFASGVIDTSMYGPPVPGASRRRGVYVEVRRNALDPFLRAFDFPEPFSAAGRRDETNVPAQSLTMMNDPAISGLANQLASQLLNDSSLVDDQSRVTQLYLRILSRTPKDYEVEAALSYLDDGERLLEKLANDKRDFIRLRDQIELQLKEIIEPAREQLLISLKNDNNVRTDQNIVPRALAEWKFDGNSNDTHGLFDLRLEGGARLENGSLVLNGQQAFAVSPPLKKPLREKTLEAWVTLNSLDQQGGGVLAVQSADGTYFDSIVFGEQQSGHWLAGSNFFERTQSFAGTPETEAISNPVHFVIVYDKDGTIRGYRNGVSYGKPYQSPGLREFPAEHSVIALGVRHFPPGGNRMLNGQILEARVYEKALTPEQVIAVWRNDPVFVTLDQVLGSISAETRRNYDELQSQLRTVKTSLGSMQGVPENPSRSLIWSDLAHSLFCMKEFVYLR